MYYCRCGYSAIVYVYLFMYIYTYIYISCQAGSPTRRDPLAEMPCLDVARRLLNPDVEKNDAVDPSLD